MANPFPSTGVIGEALNTQGFVGNNTTDHELGIGLLTFGFQWPDSDIWISFAQNVTTNWTSFAQGVTTTWTVF